MEQAQTYRFSLKMLATFLAVLMAVLSLPLSAYALLFEGEDEPSSIFETEEISVTPVGVVAELPDLRTENTKTFLMEDGSFYLAQYDTAVHTLDTNDKWQDIDNTLNVSGDEISTSDAKVKFAKKTTGNGSLFTLHNGNQKLSLSLIGAAKKVVGQITNHSTTFAEDATEITKMTTLDKIAASVRYENILANTDLEYVVTGNNIKENIIVKSTAENYTYDFELSLNNLTVAETEDGGLVLADATTGETA